MSTLEFGVIVTEWLSPRRSMPTPALKLPPET